MAAPLSSKIEWELANPLWAQTLNPIVGNPILSGKTLTKIQLINGTTIINHGLGRLMQGWFITDQNALASIYRSTPLNDSTLTLTSSAIVTVNLWVF